MSTKKNNVPENANQSSIAVKADNAVQENVSQPTIEEVTPDPATEEDTRPVNEAPTQVINITNGDAVVAKEETLPEEYRTELVPDSDNQGEDVQEPAGMKQAKKRAFEVRKDALKKAKWILVNGETLYLGELEVTTNSARIINALPVNKVEKDQAEAQGRTEQSEFMVKTVKQWYAGMVAKKLQPINFVGASVNVLHYELSDLEECFVEQALIAIDYGVKQSFVNVINSQILDA